MDQVPDFGFLRPINMIKGVGETTGDRIDNFSFLPEDLKQLLSTVSIISSKGYFKSKEERKPFKLKKFSIIKTCCFFSFLLSEI